MLTINNYKLIEYMNQPPEVIELYLVMLRYIKPLETKQKVLNMSLEDVEFIRTSINSSEDLSLIKIVSMVQELSEEEVLDLKIIEFFGLLNSIRKQFNTILDAEETAFTPSEVNVKWEMADGARRMAKFGIYNTLESLSGGDALKYKRYLDMPYSEVFTILLMRKEYSDIQAEMRRNKTKIE